MKKRVQHASQLIHQSMRVVKQQKKTHTPPPDF